ncbi:hypothetical protein MMC14_009835 [Varicellaria rhodocarpa]|nr:hypothetical protein [Varicellaria rhodocarpa]
MQAPFRLRPAKPRVTRVNEDPELLDQAMIRVLGRGGDELLTDEVKWLSVTHKSFDHGRRGYNARLAYFGKRIVDLQTSIALVNTSTATLAPPVEDQYGRMPFQHPALERLPLLNNETLHTSKELSRVASVAVKYRLIDVIRWEPKSYSLKGSGSEKVSAQALYAIVGAVALQNGGQVAIRIVQERILSPLGLT